VTDWKRAEVAHLHRETATVTTLRLRVVDWRGHLAGQHVDVRLTAEDGYTATRSYSIATPAAPRGVPTIEITVQETTNGEVSPFLAYIAGVGDQLEVRGPIGGWFTWQAEQTEPIQLVAGGSGVVPLMSMLRSADASADRGRMRLLYSTRSPETVIYRAELDSRAASTEPSPVVYRFTRSGGASDAAMIGRIDALTIMDSTIPASVQPTCYVCGPNGFVETAAALLIDAGHDPRFIRTERFG
jgi:ferredoxin-NADP reductase